MQFEFGHKNISYDNFLELFPEEGLIVKDIVHSDVCLIIDEASRSFSLKYKEFNPVKIDVKNILDKHKYFFTKNSFYKDPLARALGLKKGKERPDVLDATAGMMGDSLLMYSYGLRSLTCAERNPLVAILVLNAIKVSNLDVNFHFGSYICDKEFDVIFFDPMYDVINKKTAPKKEMEIFRQIVGKDQDAKEMASNLKLKAIERLVIKRSSKAPFLLEAPSHTIKGKSTSYDVYL